jgi:hypothetical protein
MQSFVASPNEAACGYAMDLWFQMKINVPINVTLVTDPLPNIKYDGTIPSEYNYSCEYH